MALGEGWVWGHVNHVFIGHISMLELGSMNDALLFCFFMICISLSFSIMLLLDLG
jgi:hypothetical protein